MTTALPAPRTPGAVSTEVCRLTIAGPAGRADLAVPVTTSVSALLPVLLRRVSTDPGRPASTWTLQRLGEAPLDLDATPQSAGLLHGDVLHLRPADDPMPEWEYDDVSDGVGQAVGAHTDRWRPELTRRLFLGLACLVLATLAAAVPVLGQGVLVPVLYAVSAVVLGAGCALDQQWSNDRGIALVTGVGACANAALAGLTSLGSTAALLSPKPGDVLLGGAAALVAAVVLLSVSRIPVAVTGTVLATAALVALTAGVGVLSGWDGARSAGTVAVTAFFFGHLAPRASLRMARLRVPQLPHNAAELQEDVDPLAEDQVKRRTAIADAFLTVVTGATAALCSGAFVLTAHADGWIGRLFPLVFATAVLLRSKHLNATWQRVPTVLCGVLGLLAGVLAWTASLTSPAGRCALLVGLLIGALLVLVGAWRLPTARLLPVWGRMADILEMLTALALLPLLLQLLHVYAHVRAAVS
ncbi:type VII secretion integral membrane protein EccD [Streptomyces lydicus]|uniref:type VII secretion integral membrane protein EccD n=1 Tax=Streptomyces lydicus TaxID=47763 RepID=UPI001011470F|nr:type VII secretion integral membrane protein EccD [Streptomyces lydicus]